MLIGQAARVLNLPVSTLRYYERKGITKPVGRYAGQRHYGPTDMAQLEFVAMAKRAGFSLSEIRQFIASSADGAPGPELARMAARKRQDVTDQIAELTRLQAYLSQLAQCACPTLAECVQTSCAAE